MNNEIYIKVKWATSAENFIPFTALPKRFAKKFVKLVIVDRSEVPEELLEEEKLLELLTEQFVLEQ